MSQIIIPPMSIPTSLLGMFGPVGKFEVIRGPLKHRCGLCLEPKPKLSRCTACQVVRYCSREHQAEHRQNHKAICNVIKMARVELNKEDHAVRNATPGDPMAPVNAFETHVGQFGEIMNTQIYMHTRYNLADIVRRVGTLDGVKEALGHLQDMLRLCRRDRMMTRYLVAPILLQLDQDQECYDFVKWWETRDDNYDPHDMDSPFLNIKGADVLEDVLYLTQEVGHVHHVTAVMLLKLKLLVDTINIILVRKVVGHRLPPELRDNVALAIIKSPISRQWVGKPHSIIKGLQKKLYLQIRRLCRSAYRLNGHFVPVLMSASKHIRDLPEHPSIGSFDESLLILQDSYDAWARHEGVLELLHSAKDITDNDSEQTILDYGLDEDLIDGDDYGSEDGQEPLLFQVNCKRLWVYLNEAVEDAMSLSEKRPSELKKLKREAAGKEERGIREAQAW